MQETRELIFVIVAAIAFVAIVLYLTIELGASIDNIFLRFLLVMLPCVCVVVMHTLYNKHGRDVIRAPVILFERARGRRGRSYKPMTPTVFDSEFEKVEGVDMM